MSKFILFFLMCIVGLGATYINTQIKYDCPEGYKQYFALCVPETMWEELMQ